MGGASGRETLLSVSNRLHNQVSKVSKRGSQISSCASNSYCLNGHTQHSSGKIRTPYPQREKRQGHHSHRMHHSHKGERVTIQRRRLMCWRKYEATTTTEGRGGGPRPSDSPARLLWETEREKKRAIGTCVSLLIHRWPCCCWWWFWTPILALDCSLPFVCILHLEYMRSSFPRTRTTGAPNGHRTHKPSRTHCWK